ncbi:hypothetical protein F5Y14DRAFT_431440 [Nemania sp. NC0429]|nr:hypothetical protein F5Y14DRAFT_431440 [Nemania sp. NC0429]
MSTSTGLPDSAIKDAHDMIHHAEQEEHEHEAAAKRGLPDKAVEAEHEFMQHAEDELDEFEVRESILTHSSMDARMMIKRVLTNVKRKNTTRAGSRRR